MVTIRNTNERYGPPVEFTANSLGEAVDAMQIALRGPIVTRDDYEIVEGEWYDSRYGLHFAVNFTGHEFCIAVGIVPLRVENTIKENDMSAMKDFAVDVSVALGDRGELTKRSQAVGQMIIDHRINGDELRRLADCLDIRQSLRYDDDPADQAVPREKFHTSGVRSKPGIDSVGDAETL